MEEESGEMHSEDDKGLLEKNKKRKVKTRAQVQALEKFYNEHKYPSEAMKLDVAESIGLTEKQVSGWFCHRRLKDKRLMNGENHVTGKQDRSSGVIQDRASGHRQDSCGSTKLGDDRNFDTREVESGRELSAAEHLFELNAHRKGIYNCMDDDDSSGSSSSLRNMSDHQNDDHIDLKSSRYLIPKFPSKVKGGKPKPGPSGYLKLKGQVENSAISAVKQQLGNHYRVDGPVLGVDFDPLPPGAFEPSMQDPVDETSVNGKAVLPASPTASKIHHQSKFGKGHEYISSMGPYNSNLDGRSFRSKLCNDDVPYHNNHTHKKFSQNNSIYYPPRNSSLELSQGSTRDISGNESRNDYGMLGRNNVERVTSVSRHHHHDRNARMEQEPRFHKYNDVSPKISEGEYIGKSSSLTMKGYEHYNSFDRGQTRQIAKDEPIYFQRKVNNENQIAAPFKSKTLAPKRTRDDFPPQQHVKRSSIVDNQAGNYPIMRSTRGELQSSSSEEEESGETSSSED